MDNMEIATKESFPSISFKRLKIELESENGVLPRSTFTKN